MLYCNMTPLTPYYLWHFHIFDKIDSFQEKKKIKGGNLHLWRTVLIVLLITHPTLRRRGDVVTTSLSLCTSQRRRRYVPSETPNDVSMERHQDVSVVRLHSVLLECRNDVSKGLNNEVPSVRLHNVSKKSQMKHPTASRWYVAKTSQWYVSTMSY